MIEQAGNPSRLRWRRRAAVSLVGLIVLAGTWTFGAGAPAALPVTDQAFSAFGTGTIVGVNVLRLGNVQALNAQVGFAGQAVNSKGLAAGVKNELGYAAQPAQPGKNAYGRGTGLEVGLLTPHPADPDPNQILLAGLAEALAPPIGGPVTKQIGPITIDPLLNVNLLRGNAQAAFDPNTCVVGKPFAYGQAEVAKVQLLNTGGKLPNGEFASPLIATSLPDDRNVAHTRTFSYLVPNGDGTFGVVSETRQQVLPLDLLNGAITIELLGEWVLRTTATGKPGGAKVEYAPAGAGPQTPVLRLKLLNSPPVTLTLQQLLGPNGLDLSLPGLLQLRVGTPPRPIGNNASPQPPAPVAADGTSASAAVDVVQLKVLDVPGLTGLDLRIGHMESSVTAPSGGVSCDLPVAKTVDPATVSGSGTFTHAITIPSDAGAVAALFGCDLVDIRAQDVISVTSGSPAFQVTAASHGGAISADGRTVTWPNLGSYRPGDPPIVLTVTVAVAPGSPAGALEDTVTVTATLGNCRSAASGTNIIGTVVAGGSVRGTVTVPGPVIVGPGTPTTAVPTTTAGNGTPQVSVLPEVITRNGRPAVGGGDLSRTGFNFAVVVAAAALMSAAGALAVRMGRNWTEDRSLWPPG